MLCECRGERKGVDRSSQHCILVASKQTSNAVEIVLRDRLVLGDKLLCETVHSPGNV